MGQKLPPDRMELYRRTDEVLHYIWDPIGVAGVPEARDEYHSYLPVVFARLLDATDVEIREYLRWVAEERMDLSADKERIDRAVEALLRWKDHCLQKRL